MTEKAIRVEGLREFNRSLRRMDSELPKALRKALNESAQTVVDKAKPRVPKRSGRAAGSIKPKSTRTAVRVGAGGRRAPYFPWLDYGGRVGRNRSVVRPFIKEGRYVYKGYFEARDSGKFEEALQKALIDVATRAGLEVD